MKLFAFQPEGHGELSFFVTAVDKQEALRLVKEYCADVIAKDEAKRLPARALVPWREEVELLDTDYYIVTEAELGKVLTNAND